MDFMPGIYHATVFAKDDTVFARETFQTERAAHDFITTTLDSAPHVMVAVTKRVYVPNTLAHYTAAGYEAVVSTHNECLYKEVFGPDEKDRADAAADAWIRDNPHRIPAHSVVEVERYAWPQWCVVHFTAEVGGDDYWMLEEESPPPESMPMYDTVSQLVYSEAEAETFFNRVRAEYIAAHRS